MLDLGSMSGRKKFPIFHFLTAGLFLSVSLSNAWAVSLRQQALEYRRQGYMHQEQGRLDKALTSYRKAVELDESYATPHNDIAILLEQLGRLNEAEAAYKKALRLNPEYVQVHANLAMLYERQGNKDQAAYHWLKRYQLGSASDPGTLRAKERVDYYVSMGAIGLPQGKAADVTNSDDPANPSVALKPPAFVDESLNMNPDSGSRKRAVKIRQEGYALQRQARYDSAEDSYREAIRIDPTYAAPYNDLGVLLESQGKIDEAEQAYRHALALDPQYIQAHANLAMLYEHTQRGERALVHWLKRYQLGRPGAPGTERAKQRLASAQMWGAIDEYAPKSVVKPPTQSAEDKMPPVYYADDPRKIDEKVPQSLADGEEAELEDDFEAQLRRITQQLQSDSGNEETGEKSAGNMAMEKPESKSVATRKKTKTVDLSGGSDKNEQEWGRPVKVGKDPEPEAQTVGVKEETPERQPTLMGHMKINDGAEQTTIPTVKLHLDLKTDTPGVEPANIAHFMQISNDGITFTEAEPYNISKKWFLDPGDGEKMVYVRLLDIDRKPVLMLTDNIDFDASALTVNVASSEETRERMIKDSFKGFDTTQKKFRAGTDEAYNP